MGFRDSEEVGVGGIPTCFYDTNDAQSGERVSAISVSPPLYTRKDLGGKHIIRLS